MSAQSETITIRRELFEWLVDYALDLRGQWQWKRNSTRSNDKEMAALDAHLSEALAIREVWPRAVTPAATGGKRHDLSLYHIQQAACAVTPAVTNGKPAKGCKL